MTTNFNYPTAAELFTSNAPVAAPPTTNSSSTGKFGIIMGLICLVGGCAAIAIYQYRMRQQLLRNINAGIKKNS